MGSKKLEETAEQLFGEALELPRERREEFLGRACGRQPALRRMVEDLLAENDRLSGFLSEPAVGKVDATAVRASGFVAGTRLAERYTVIGVVGSGGMGMVYRARDEKLQRDIAIKMLQPGVLVDEESRARFRREAHALAKLNHAHIAAVYDVIEQEGVDFIVMELVAGESLAAKLKLGALPVGEATAITLQVAEALEEAHERGVIHRDLKPANVMITPKGQAKVLDFGLAKLLGSAEATQSLAETRGVMGTPLYMSPEQALGKAADERTDLWSLGVLYYEALTGATPFHGASALAVLEAITTDPFKPVREVRPEVPAAPEQIVTRALEKDPSRRYATASAMKQDLADLLARMSSPLHALEKPGRPGVIWIAGTALLLVAFAAVGTWLYRRAAERRWARTEAVAQMNDLIAAKKPLAAWLTLEKAEKILPSDAELRQAEEANTDTVAVHSDPAGAVVAIQDYLTPDAGWRKLGTTPLESVRIPNGYFRWRVAKAGASEMVVAPEAAKTMEFSLTAQAKAPAGMVYAAGGSWGTYVAFIGWLGPYNFAPYYIDRYEVTNREYQKFVDSGGYTKQQYWPAEFEKDGRKVAWANAMAEFRDATGRPGPATWSGGHYPDGQGDFPVSGVSWYEAAAYAKSVGKELPVLGQWYQAASPDEAEYVVLMSNITKSAPAAVGTYKGVGPYGTYDMAGNVREWVANPVDDGLRFILGGSWKSQAYLYGDPEALSPFDREDGNGFRCVQNLGAVPEKAAALVHRVTRDFSTYKPVSDEVFAAYKLLYAYQQTPLNAKAEGVVKETADWREEKVTFDAAYGGERMAAYLFLPKRVRPPYQTVLFFPSARVMFLPPDSRELGDVKFFDYVVESGRAVMYPVYEDTYERRLKYNLPSGAESIDLATEWYKDAARSLDYLATRGDIDYRRLGYLGVSMGAADGVIFATLLQDRLKAVVLLDGGFFMQKPLAGVDQADFAPRMKKPVLIVNGRYDYTFPVEKAQDPLFRMLGTPPEDKKHVVLDTPHDVTEQRGQLVKVVLDWLDRYLGRVGEQGPGGGN
jgi:formylglycine-generating enzyme required for sulfatase activity/tRNA A-37 threonylcarbamoyl transferase component Bud32